MIFDLFNEPDNISWSCWRDGGAACAGAPFTIAGMQELVNVVRGTGATNVVMLGGLQWSSDLSQWLGSEPSDPLHNLAASLHVYDFSGCNTQSCWDSTVAPVAAQVPVITGEMGESDSQSNPTLPFLTAFWTWQDAHCLSYLAWTWTPGATGSRW